MTWLSDEAWWHVVAPLTSGSALRSAALLNKIVDQFNVDTAVRYQRSPGPGGTKCNIFLNDVTRALGCEIAQMEHRAATIIELNANDQIDWLTSWRGANTGWREVGAIDARTRADLGYPTAVVWKNPGGIGHVALAVPAPAGAIVDANVWIAQAGGRNFRLMQVQSGFGANKVRYFTHD